MHPPAADVWTNYGLRTGKWSKHRTRCSLARLRPGVGFRAVVLTRRRKLAYTIVLFAIAIGLVLVASAVQEAGPLFAVWIPLLTVPWLLTRPEPGDPPRVAAEPTEGAAESSPQEDEGRAFPD